MFVNGKLVTVGLQGDDYVVMILPDQRGVKLNEDEAKIIRNYLCALLGIPTNEEIDALG